jgi:hypothetical protein
MSDEAFDYWFNLSAFIVLGIFTSLMLAGIEWARPIVQIGSAALIGWSLRRMVVKFRAQRNRLLRKGPDVFRVGHKPISKQR